MGVEERKLKLKRFESVIKAAMTLVEIGDIGDIIADDRSQKTTFTALQQNSSFIKQSYTIPTTAHPEFPIYPHTATIAKPSYRHGAHYFHFSHPRTNAIKHLQDIIQTGRKEVTWLKQKTNPFLGDLPAAPII